jgi:hypothetical protein
MYIQDKRVEFIKKKCCSLYISYNNNWQGSTDNKQIILRETYMKEDIIAIEYIKLVG